MIRPKLLLLPFLISFTCPANGSEPKLLKDSEYLFTITNVGQHPAVGSPHSLIPNKAYKTAKKEDPLILRFTNKGEQISILPERCSGILMKKGIIATYTTLGSGGPVISSLRSQVIQSDKKTEQSGVDQATTVPESKQEGKEKTKPESKKWKIGVVKERMNGEVNEIPRDGFADFVELKNWATSSCFGGGGAKKAQIGGKNVYYSQRTFTSGLVTSELIFFYDSSDGRIRKFLSVPKQYREFIVIPGKDYINVGIQDGISPNGIISISPVMNIWPRMIPNHLPKPPTKKIE